jgi:hypothetical protein
METNDYNIGVETIIKLGLKSGDKKINAQISRDARIFEYPDLENVFIMENDLYGNIMPKDYCFLAFYGNHGLIGKALRMETLSNSSVADIQAIVKSNTEG